MNELETIQIFLKVAELDSFSGAARQLGLPNATVSSAVRQLEANLGTRLLQRTTRRVQLTQEGEAFYARSRELVLPRLGEFMARHPQLAIDLGTADRRVDLIREGYDCVLRAGPLLDSSLVARPLGSYRQVNCASPAYLEQYGTPRRLDDLARHRLIHYDAQLGGSAAAWEWFDGEQTHYAPVGSMLTVNGTASYKAACLAGLGIIQVPRAGLRELIEAGKLVEVMEDYRPAPMPVAFVYPTRRHVPARAVAFMDWVAGLLQPYLE